jgi:predicted RNA-binding Zn ribbon-like protein
VRLPTPTGQWFASSDGTRWWFDSGSVALDFAYTGGFSERWESLHRPADLAGWLSGRFPELADFDPTAVGERDLTDAKGLRDSLAALARAASRSEPAPAGDVDVVNLFAATPDIPPAALSGGSRRAGRTSAQPRQALSAMAREAVQLFGAAPERIRECAAHECGLIFYDESRSNNRRWCSMQRCGNRAKVRAHRGRTGSAA